MKLLKDKKALAAIVTLLAALAGLAGIEISDESQSKAVDVISDIVEVENE